MSSYYDWSSGDIITSTRLNGPWSATGDLSLAGKTLIYARAYAAPVALGSNATTCDASAGTVFTATYTQSKTLTISNLVTGQAIVIVANATGAGPWTLTLATTEVDTIKWAGGIDNSAITTAKTNIYTIIKVGTKFYVNASKDFTT